MHQDIVPCFPLPYSAPMMEMGEWMHSAFERIERDTGQTVPVILFEPHPDWQTYRPAPAVSPAPQALIVIPIIPAVTAHCFRALAEVEKREPAVEHCLGPARIKLKGNTPMKSIFKQMAAVPLTVFSFNDEETSIFFLRTRFTISEFLREFEKPVEPVPNN